MISISLYSAKAVRKAPDNATRRAVPFRDVPCRAALQSHSLLATCGAFGQTVYFSCLPLVQVLSLRPTASTSPVTTAYR